MNTGDKDHVADLKDSPSALPPSDEVGGAPAQQADGPYTVAALYKFMALPDYEVLRAPLLTMCKKHGIFGTILLALVCINGTFFGTHEAIAALMVPFAYDQPLSDVAPNFS